MSELSAHRAAPSADEVYEMHLKRDAELEAYEAYSITRDPHSFPVGTRVSINGAWTGTVVSEGATEHEVELSNGHETVRAWFPEETLIKLMGDADAEDSASTIVVTGEDK